MRDKDRDAAAGQDTKLWPGLGSRVVLSLCRFPTMRGSTVGVKVMVWRSDEAVHRKTVCLVFQLLSLQPTDQLQQDTAFQWCYAPVVLPHSPGWRQ